MNDDPAPRSKCECPDDPQTCRSCGHEHGEECEQIGYDNGVKAERARIENIIRQEIHQWRAVRSSCQTLGTPTDGTVKAQVCIDALGDVLAALGTRGEPSPSQDAS